MDTTGNSRFWTIAVERIDFDHGIDMQQVFAELKAEFETGREWWLSSDEEAALDKVNHGHRLMSSVEARISEELDLDRQGKADLQNLTANEVLRKIGFERPTNAQSKEANVALRALLGESKRVRGQNRWRIPWNAHEPTGRDLKAETTY